MKMKTKQNIILWLTVISFFIPIVGGITLYERFRWHTFQKYTHMKIGFWEWKFIFDGKVRIEGGKIK